ncbi:MAG TPA: hypothetical protein PKL97_07935 [Candidatus Omnitrophota bacterium]|nr:hypothetical protein [Candidatus Omnitrophota bacterium]
MNAELAAAVQNIGMYDALIDQVTAQIAAAQTSRTPDSNESEELISLREELDRLSAERAKVRERVEDLRARAPVLQAEILGISNPSLTGASLGDRDEEDAFRLRNFDEWIGSSFNAQIQPASSGFSAKIRASTPEEEREQQALGVVEANGIEETLAAIGSKNPDWAVAFAEAISLLTEEEKRFLSDRVFSFRGDEETEDSLVVIYPAEGRIDVNWRVFQGADRETIRLFLSHVFFPHLVDRHRSGQRPAVVEIVTLLRDMNRLLALSPDEREKIIAHLKRLDGGNAGSLSALFEQSVRTGEVSLESVREFLAGDFAQKGLALPKGTNDIVQFVMKFRNAFGGIEMVELREALEAQSSEEQAEDVSGILDRIQHSEDWDISEILELFKEGVDVARADIAFELESMELVSIELMKQWMRGLAVEGQLESLRAMPDSEKIVRLMSRVLPLAASAMTEGGLYDRFVKYAGDHEGVLPAEFLERLNLLPQLMHRVWADGPDAIWQYREFIRLANSLWRLIENNPEISGDQVAKGCRQLLEQLELVRAVEITESDSEVLEVFHRLIREWARSGRDVFETPPENIVPLNLKEWVLYVLRKGHTSNLAQLKEAQFNELIQMLAKNEILPVVLPLYAIAKLYLGNMNIDVETGSRIGLFNVPIQAAADIGFSTTVAEWRGALWKEIAFFTSHLGLALLRTEFLGQGKVSITVNSETIEIDFDMDEYNQLREAVGLIREKIETDPFSEIRRALGEETTRLSAGTGTASSSAVTLSEIPGSVLETGSTFGGIEERPEMDAPVDALVAAGIIPDEARGSVRRAIDAIPRALRMNDWSEVAAAEAGMENNRDLPYYCRARGRFERAMELEEQDPVRATLLQEASQYLNAIHDQAFDDAVEGLQTGIESFLASSLGKQIERDGMRTVTAESLGGPAEALQEFLRTKKTGRKTTTPEFLADSLVDTGIAVISSFMNRLHAQYPDAQSLVVERYPGLTEGLQTALEQYRQNGEKVLREDLLTREAMEQRIQPRIEVRKAWDGEITQMVIAGPFGDYRTDASLALTDALGPLASEFSVREGGISSLEINLRGVDKSLPIDFLSRHFDDVLAEMGYTPGPLIDARKTRTVVLTDGDGTIYGEPAAWDPLAKNMANSEARDSLIKYLEAGGVYVLVSGNEAERTRQKLIMDGEGIPRHLRNRVLVVVEGSAIMHAIAEDGNFHEIESYRKQALSESFQAGETEPLDAIYAGDRESPNSNDAPGFIRINLIDGVNRAVMVSKKPPLELSGRFLGGNQKGTGAFLAAAVEEAESNPGQPLFTDEKLNRIMARAGTLLESAGSLGIVPRMKRMIAPVLLAVTLLSIAGPAVAAEEGALNFSAAQKAAQVPPPVSAGPPVRRGSSTRRLIMGLGVAAGTQYLLQSLDRGFARQGRASDDTLRLLTRSLAPVPGLYFHEYAHAAKAYDLAPDNFREPGLLRIHGYSVTNILIGAGIGMMTGKLSKGNLVLPIYFPSTGTVNQQFRSSNKYPTLGEWTLGNPRTLREICLAGPLANFTFGAVSPKSPGGLSSLGMGTENLSPYGLFDVVGLFDSRFKGGVSDGAHVFREQSTGTKFLLTGGLSYLSYTSQGTKLLSQSAPYLGSLSALRLMGDSGRIAGADGLSDDLSDLNDSRWSFSILPSSGTGTTSAVIYSGRFDFDSLFGGGRRQAEMPAVQVTAPTTPGTPVSSVLLSAQSLGNQTRTGLFDSVSGASLGTGARYPKLSEDLPIRNPDQDHLWEAVSIPAVFEFLGGSGEDGRRLDEAGRRARGEDIVRRFREVMQNRGIRDILFDSQVYSDGAKLAMMLEILRRVRDGESPADVAPAASRFITELAKAEARYGVLTTIGEEYEVKPQFEDPARYPPEQYPRYPLHVARGVFENIIGGQLGADWDGPYAIIEYANYASYSFMVQDTIRGLLKELGFLPDSRWPSHRWQSKHTSVAFYENADKLAAIRKIARYIGFADAVLYTDPTRIEFFAANALLPIDVKGGSTNVDEVPGPKPAVQIEKEEPGRAPTRLEFRLGDSIADGSTRMIQFMHGCMLQAIETAFRLKVDPDAPVSKFERRLIGLLNDFMVTIDALGENPDVGEVLNLNWFSSEGNQKLLRIIDFQQNAELRGAVQQAVETLLAGVEEALDDMPEDIVRQADAGEVKALPIMRRLMEEMEANPEAVREVGIQMLDNEIGNLRDNDFQSNQALINEMLGNLERNFFSGRESPSPRPVDWESFRRAFNGIEDIRESPGFNREVLRERFMRGPIRDFITSVNAGRFSLRDMFSSIPEAYPNRKLFGWFSAAGFLGLALAALYALNFLGGGALIQQLFYGALAGLTISLFGQIYQTLLGRVHNGEILDPGFVRATDAELGARVSPLFHDPQNPGTVVVVQDMIEMDLNQFNDTVLRGYPDGLRQTAFETFQRIGFYHDTQSNVLYVNPRPGRPLSAQAPSVYLRGRRFVNNALYDGGTRRLFICRNAAASPNFWLGLVLAHERGKRTFFNLRERYPNFHLNRLSAEIIGKIFEFSYLFLGGIQRAGENAAIFAALGFSLPVAALLNFRSGVRALLGLPSLIISRLRAGQRTKRILNGLYADIGGLREGPHNRGVLSNAIAQAITVLEAQGVDEDGMREVLGRVVSRRMDRTPENAIRHYLQGPFVRGEIIDSVTRSLAERHREWLTERDTDDHLFRSAVADAYDAMRASGGRYTDIRNRLDQVLREARAGNPGADPVTVLGDFTRGLGNAAGASLGSEQKVTLGGREVTIVLGDVFKTDAEAVVVTHFNKMPGIEAGENGQERRELDLGRYLSAGIDRAFGVSRPDGGFKIDPAVNPDQINPYEVGAATPEDFRLGQAFLRTPVPKKSGLRAVVAAIIYDVGGAGADFRTDDRAIREKRERIRAATKNALIAAYRAGLKKIAFTALGTGRMMNFNSEREPVSAMYEGIRDFQSEYGQADLEITVAVIDQATYETFIKEAERSPAAAPVAAKEKAPASPAVARLWSQPAATRQTLSPLVSAGQKDWFRDLVGSIVRDGEEFKFGEIKEGNDEASKELSGLIGGLLGDGHWGVLEILTNAVRDRYVYESRRLEAEGYKGSIHDQAVVRTATIVRQASDQARNREESNAAIFRDFLESVRPDLESGASLGTTEEALSLLIRYGSYFEQGDKVAVSGDMYDVVWNIKYDEAERAIRAGVIVAENKSLVFPNKTVKDAYRIFKDNGMKWNGEDPADVLRGIARGEIVPDQTGKTLVRVGRSGELSAGAGRQPESGGQGVLYVLPGIKKDGNPVEVRITGRLARLYDKAVGYVRVGESEKQQAKQQLRIELEAVCPIREGDLFECDGVIYRVKWVLMDIKSGTTADRLGDPGYYRVNIRFDRLKNVGANPEADEIAEDKILFLTDDKFAGRELTFVTRDQALQVLQSREEENARAAEQTRKNLARRNLEIQIKSWKEATDLSRLPPMDSLETARGKARTEGFEDLAAEIEILLERKSFYDHYSAPLAEINVRLFSLERLLKELPKIGTMKTAEGQKWIEELRGILGDDPVAKIDQMEATLTELMTRLEGYQAKDETVRAEADKVKDRIQKTKDRLGALKPTVGNYASWRTQVEAPYSREDAVREQRLLSALQNGQTVDIGESLDHRVAQSDWDAVEEIFSTLRDSIQLRSEAGYDREIYKRKLQEAIRKLTALSPQMREELKKHLFITRGWVNGDMARSSEWLRSFFRIYHHSYYLFPGNLILLGRIRQYVPVNWRDFKTINYVEPIFSSVAGGFNMGTNNEEVIVLMDEHRMDLDLTAVHEAQHQVDALLEEEMRQRGISVKMKPWQKEFTAYVRSLFEIARRLREPGETPESIDELLNKLFGGRDISELYFRKEGESEEEHVRAAMVFRARYTMRLLELAKYGDRYYQFDGGYEDKEIEGMTEEDVSRRTDLNDYARQSLARKIRWRDRRQSVLDGWEGKRGWDAWDRKTGAEKRMAGGNPRTFGGVPREYWNVAHWTNAEMLESVARRLLRDFYEEIFGVDVSTFPEFGRPVPVTVPAAEISPEAQAFRQQPQADVPGISEVQSASVQASGPASRGSAQELPLGQPITLRAGQSRQFFIPDSMLDFSKREMVVIGARGNLLLRKKQSRPGMLTLQVDRSTDILLAQDGSTQSPYLGRRSIQYQQAPGGFLVTVTDGGSTSGTTILRASAGSLGSEGEVLGSLEEVLNPGRPLSDIEKDLREMFPEGNIVLNQNGFYLNRKTVAVADALIPGIYRLAMAHPEIAGARPIAVLDTNFKDGTIAAGNIAGEGISEDIRNKFYDALSAAEKENLFKVFADRVRSGRTLHVDHHYDYPVLATTSTAVLMLDFLLYLHRNGRLDLIQRLKQSFGIMDHSDTDILLAHFILRHADDFEFLADNEELLKDTVIFNDYQMGRGDETHRAQVAILYDITVAWHERIMRGELTAQAALNQMGAAIDFSRKYGERVPSEAKLFEQVSVTDPQGEIRFDRTGPLYSGASDVERGFLEDFFEGAEDYFLDRRIIENMFKRYDPDSARISEGDIRRTGAILFIYVDDTAEKEVGNGSVLRYFQTEHPDILGSVFAIVTTSPAPQSKETPKSRLVKIRSFLMPDGRFLNLSREFWSTLRQDGYPEADGRGMAGGLTSRPAAINDMPKVVGDVNAAVEEEVRKQSLRMPLPGSSGTGPIETGKSLGTEEIPAGDGVLPGAKEIMTALEADSEKALSREQIEGLVGDAMQRWLERAKAEFQADYELPLNQLMGDMRQAIANRINEAESDAAAMQFLMSEDFSLFLEDRFARGLENLPDTAKDTLRERMGDEVGTIALAIRSALIEGASREVFGKLEMSEAGIQAIGDLFAGEGAEIPGLLNEALNRLIARGDASFAAVSERFGLTENAFTATRVDFSENPHYVVDYALAQRTSDGGPEVFRQLAGTRLTITCGRGDMREVRELIQSLGISAAMIPHPVTQAKVGKDIIAALDMDTPTAFRDVNDAVKVSGGVVAAAKLDSRTLMRLLLTVLTTKEIRENVAKNDQNILILDENTLNALFNLFSRLAEEAATLKKVKAAA